MSATTSNPGGYAILNPATGQLVRSYAGHSDAAIEQAIGQSSRCFDQWRTLDFAERAASFRSLAEKLRGEQEALAVTMAQEMGKPVSQGKAEAEKCAFVCEYFAAQAEGFLAPRTIGTDSRLSEVIYRPLGPVFAIMPWNFPLWQVFRAAAPNLMAGNTMILKHAPNVPETAESIERMMHQAGFPPAALSQIRASNEQAGQIIAHRAIKGICLTGSGRAGRAVGAAAGQHLKPALLELGGSDPYLVLKDADLGLAADKIATSRMLNNGQTCISAKRFIVDASVVDEFTERLVAKLGDYRMGDPMNPEINQGPMAREDLRDALHDQVTRSVKAGARLVCGGTLPPGDGFFYPATLLSDVRPGMPAFEEEFFGPVGSIIAAKDENEAIQLANQTVYGLGAAVFTRDTDRGLSIARDRLEAGTCVVNDFVRSDPRLPFGGINESGFGRELGAEGIRAFTNLKTICLGA